MNRPALFLHRIYCALLAMGRTAQYVHDHGQVLYLRDFDLGVRGSLLHQTATTQNRGDRAFIRPFLRNAPPSCCWTSSTDIITICTSGIALRVGILGA